MKHRKQNRIKNRMIGRLIPAVLALAVMVCMGAGTDQVWAASIGDDDAALDVYYDDTLVKSFSRNDLNAIAAEEGDKTYTFSRFNTNVIPSPDVLADVKGPTIEGIIDHALADPEEHAGVELPADLDAIGEDQTIQLRASSRSANAYSALFTKAQLFGTRYCFPKVTEVAEMVQTDGHIGMSLPGSWYEGKTEVPPIISTAEPDPNNQSETEVEAKKRAGRSLYGQIVPNEQNAPDCVQGMLRKYENADPGRITISSASAEKWAPLQTTDAGDGGDVKTGSQISFDPSVNEYKQNGGFRYWIYYTIDGTEPSIASEQYNYNNNGHGAENEGFNRPEVTAIGELVIKAKVIGNGRPDSETTTFRFRGVKDLIDVDIYGASAARTYSGTQQSVQGFTYKTVPEDAATVAEKVSGSVKTAGRNAGTYPLTLQADQFDIAPVDPDCGIGTVTLHAGKLVIRPAKLTITTNSAKKVFDGKALTAAGSIRGFVGGDRAAFAPSGKQVAPGSSRNTYRLLWNGTAKQSNYTIGSAKLGTLTVTAPSVAAPKMKALSLKKKTITVKWKKVAGASGYQIYRSNKKSGGYKMVKKISKGSTVSWKNKSLKKGKKYYYKVRAYKTIAGRTFYSGFSQVKYKKVK